MLLDKEYGPAIDWWGFGVLLYQMLLHRSPFRGEDEDEIYDAILADDPPFPAQLSESAIDILQKLLIRDSKARLGCNGSSEVMQHAFFRNIDWDRLSRREITPPFIPETIGMESLDNVDTKGTSQASVSSFARSGMYGIEHVENKADMG